LSASCWPSPFSAYREQLGLDIHSFQLGRVIPPDLGIVSDAKLALKEMRSAAGEMAEAREPGSWVERVDELRSTMRRKMDFDNVPIKPQRVFKEINEFFDEDTIFVTAIGLYQIWSGQFHETYKPRHYLCCGQAGPLGWEIPACIGAKLGKPENLVVGVVGDYTFQFLEEEIAVAVQFKVPYVLIMVNNAYASLIRQPEDKKYDMNFGVDFSYEGPEGPMGVDFVTFMESQGALGRRVTEPEDMKAAFQWAVDVSEEKQVPALVEVIVERETDAAMGVSMDAINEFEPLEDRAPKPSGSLPERD
jgi:tartronate-semialdehyde synthase